MSIKLRIDTDGKVSLEDYAFLGYMPGTKVEIIRTITNTLMIKIDDAPPPELRGVLKSEYRKLGLKLPEVLPERT